MTTRENNTYCIITQFCVFKTETCVKKNVAVLCDCDRFTGFWTEGGNVACSGIKGVGI